MFYEKGKRSDGVEIYKVKMKKGGKKLWKMYYSD